MRISGLESRVSGGEAVRAPAGVAQAQRRLRRATDRLVGSVFYGTLLKSMRESKLKATIGHGGRGEEVFSGQLHGILAERIGEGTRHGLGEALRARLERQQGLIEAARGAATPEVKI